MCAKVSEKPVCEHGLQGPFGVSRKVLHISSSSAKPPMHINFKHTRLPTSGRFMKNRRNGEGGGGTTTRGTTVAKIKFQGCTKTSSGGCTKTCSGGCANYVPGDVSFVNETSQGFTKHQRKRVIEVGVPPPKN